MIGGREGGGERRGRSECSWEGRGVGIHLGVSGEVGRSRARIRVRVVKVGIVILIIGRGCIALIHLLCRLRIPIGGGLG